MSLPALDNLVRIGQLKAEPRNEAEAKRELGIPDEYSVIMPIAVGHAREQPWPTPRRAARILSLT